MEKIDIVTRGDRGVEWLNRCYESLRGLHLPWTWHIMATDRVVDDLYRYKGAYVGTEVHRVPSHRDVHDALKSVNHYFNIIPDRGQWFFNMDDDTLMHPNFSNIGPFMESHDILFFSQQVTPTWVRNIEPDKFGPRLIDMAQFCARRSAIGTLRFWEIYRGDSYFIQELVERAKGGLGFLPQRIGHLYEPLSYYNAQRAPFTDRP